MLIRSPCWVTQQEEIQNKRATRKLVWVCQGPPMLHISPSRGSAAQTADSPVLSAQSSSLGTCTRAGILNLFETEGLSFFFFFTSQINERKANKQEIKIYLTALQFNASHDKQINSWVITGNVFYDVTVIFDLRLQNWNQFHVGSRLMFVPNWKKTPQAFPRYDFTRVEYGQHFAWGHVIFKPNKS